MKIHFNINKNLAMEVLYKHLLQYITKDENGKKRETITIPRVNLGDDILTIIVSYNLVKDEYFKFIDTDNIKNNSIYVMFSGMNKNGENKFWKIDKETFSKIESFLKDCEEIMKWHSKRVKGRNKI